LGLFNFLFGRHLTSAVEKSKDNSLSYIKYDPEKYP